MNHHLCVTQGSFHVVTHHAYTSVTAWLLKTKALAVPAFDRIAGLYNRHLNSNMGIYAYGNDFEVRLRALTDLAKD